MTRIILAVAVTIALAVFAMANMHVVVLSLVVGPQVQIRLIFLLMSAFLAGVISAWFFMMVRKIRLKRRLLKGPVKGEKSGGLERQFDVD